jgi:hypothetical protein
MGTPSVKTTEVYPVPAWLLREAPRIAAFYCTWAEYDVDRTVRLAGTLLSEKMIDLPNQPVVFAFAILTDIMFQRCRRRYHDEARCFVEGWKNLFDKKIVIGFLERCIQT